MNAFVGFCGVGETTGFRTQEQFLEDKRIRRG
jgi:hypothetical protein